MFNKQRGIAMTMVLYLVSAVAILGIISIGMWKIHHAGYLKGKAEVQLAWDQAVAAQAKKEQAQSAGASTKLEADRVKTRTVYRTITKSVDKYIDRPIYRNVCFDEPGLRDANSALIRATAAASKPDAAVPAADAARERAGRDSASEADRSR